MRRLTHISPGSAFKVGLVVYGLLFAIFGLIALLFTSMGIRALRSFINIGGIGFFRGLLAYIVGVVFNGVVGGVISALVAAIYNGVAGWTGGLEIRLSPEAKE